jgi:hypothetical protein
VVEGGRWWYTRRVAEYEAAALGAASERLSEKQMAEFDRDLLRQIGRDAEEGFPILDILRGLGPPEQLVDRWLRGERLTSWPH